MLELLLKLSDITEKIFPLFFLNWYFDLNQNFFVSSFFWHTGSGIEYYYFIYENFLYIFFIFVFCCSYWCYFFLFMKKDCKDKMKNIFFKLSCLFRKLFFVIFSFYSIFRIFLKYNCLNECTNQIEKIDFKKFIRKYYSLKCYYIGCMSCFSFSKFLFLSVFVTNSWKLFYFYSFYSPYSFLFFFYHYRFNFLCNKI